MLFLCKADIINLIEYEYTVRPVRRAFNREDGTPRFSALPHCPRNRKSVFAPCTVKYGKEGCRYALNDVYETL